jgi:hypothetical protein
MSATFGEATFGVTTCLPDHATDGLDEGEFTEGHELPRRWKVAEQMIGRRLSQAEAKRLLAKFE